MTNLDQVRATFQGAAWGFSQPLGETSRAGVPLEPALRLRDQLIGA